MTNDSECIIMKVCVSKHREEDIAKVSLCVLNVFGLLRMYLYMYLYDRMYLRAYVFLLCYFSFAHRARWRFEHGAAFQSSTRAWH
jgi:hypothetical protein